MTSSPQNDSEAVDQLSSMTTLDESSLQKILHLLQPFKSSSVETQVSIKVLEKWIPTAVFEKPPRLCTALNLLFLYTKMGSSGALVAGKLVQKILKSEAPTKEALNSLLDEMESLKPKTMKKKIDFLVSIFKYVLRHFDTNKGIVECLARISDFDDSILKRFDNENEINLLWEEIIESSCLNAVARGIHQNKVFFIKRVIHHVESEEDEDELLLESSCGVISRMEGQEFDSFIEFFLNYLFVQWDDNRNFKTLFFLNNILLFLHQIAPLEIREEMENVFSCYENHPWHIRLIVGPAFNLNDIDPFFFEINDFNLIKDSLSGPLRLLLEHHNGFEKSLSANDELEYKYLLSAVSSDNEKMKSLVEFEKKLSRLESDVVALVTKQKLLAGRVVNRLAQLI